MLRTGSTTPPLFLFPSRTKTTFAPCTQRAGKRIGSGPCFFQIMRVTGCDYKNTRRWFDRSPRKNMLLSFHTLGNETKSMKLISETATCHVTMTSTRPMSVTHDDPRASCRSGSVPACIRSLQSPSRTNQPYGMLIYLKQIDTHPCTQVTNHSAIDRTIGIGLFARDQRRQTGRRVCRSKQCRYI